MKRILISVACLGAALGPTLGATGCSSSGSPSLTPPDGGTADSGAFLDAGSIANPFVQPCSSDAQCASGVCGVAGSGGQCCNQRCDVGDPLCGATGCDQSGACVYPDSASGCGQRCENGTLTALSCNGRGRCVAGGSTVCASGSGCALGNTACAAHCLDDSNCAADAYCDQAGDCLPRVAVGPCQSNDACVSGICGLQGRGSCCASQCNDGDSVCGATGCDPSTGACVYPPAGSSCGPSHCDGVTLTSGRCDGVSGVCSGAVTAPCPNNFSCSGNRFVCNNTCSSNLDCAPHAFCAPGGTRCCPNFPGQVLHVDDQAGSDSPCCGSGTGSAACASVGYALQEVDRQALVGMRVAVEPSLYFLNGLALPYNWNPSGGEPYPLQLGWGVNLEVSGVTFTSPSQMFQVQHYPGEGDAGPYAPVRIAGGQYPAVFKAGGGNEGVITYSPGNVINSGGDGEPEIVLSNASFISTAYADGSIDSQGYTPPPELAVTIHGHTGVTIGPLPVTISTNGPYSTAVSCAGAGGYLRDTPGGSAQQLTVLNSGSPGSGLAMGDGCSVNLASGPTFGRQDIYGQCRNFLSTAVNTSGNVSVSLGSPAAPAVIHCQLGYGIYASGSGSLQLTGSVSESGCAGVYLSGGSFAATNLTLAHNDVGLWVDPPGLTSFRLSGVTNLNCNGFATNNTGVTPSCLSAGINGGHSVSGAGVYINAPGNYDLSRTLWTSYDGGATDLYSCDLQGALLNNCTCSGGGCAGSPPVLPSTALPDGVDVVTVRSAASVIATYDGGAAASCPAG